MIAATATSAARPGRGEISKNAGKAPADPLEFFIEPEWCVELMAEHLIFSGETVDPCAGSGTIPRVLREAGAESVWAGDIKQHEHYWMLDFQQDFLDPQWFGMLSVPQFSNIVFHPPFKPAVRFIKKALQIASEKVVALVPLKFLAGQKRGDWFNSAEGAPTQIMFLSDRPSMPPGDLLLAGKIEAKGGKVDYCWIVWDKRERYPKPPLWLRRSKDSD